MCLEYLTDLVLDGDGFTCLTISKLLIDTILPIRIKSIKHNHFSMYSSNETIFNNLSGNVILLRFKPLATCLIVL